MFGALVWKELRDSWMWGLAALAALSWVAISFIVDFQPGLLRELDIFKSPPGRSSTDVGLLWIVLTSGSIMFGVALGIWQTVPESAAGTAAMLVHIAQGRRRVVGAKILAALLLFGAALFLPYFVTKELTSWIERTSALPGRLDVLHGYKLLVSGVAVYLGILAAGLRGLPWRQGLQPLAGLVVVAFGVAAALVTNRFEPTLAAVALSGGAWAFSGFAAREF